MICTNWKTSLFSVIFLCLLTASAKATTGEYDITAFGAIKNGTAVNTKAIQAAIDACNAAGGGSVIVPGGTFITGTIHLKSNVNLVLQNGAVLKGSSNLNDYETYTLPQYGTNHYGILYTHDAENVAITGLGSIDGNDKAFFDFAHAKKIDANGTRFTRQKENYRKITNEPGDGPVVPQDRPHQMVIFTACHHVSVLNVSLLSSPFWTLHFMDCDDVRVSGIRLWSGLLIPNGDGIDMTSSSNITISDCDIRTGDDALVVGGYNHHFEIPGFNYAHHVCENIVVTNCNLQSASSAIRVGFLDQNDVRNIHFSHINITNSTRGIGVFLRDEGSIENVSFDDIYIDTKLRTGDWWGNGEPVHISAVRGKENVQLGHIRHIQFRNLTCRGENGFIMYGSAESKIEDVTFDHVTLDIVNSKLNDVAGGNIDLRGCLHENEQLFAHDIPGFFAHYVNGLTIDNFRLNWDKTINQPYFTDGLRAEYFGGLKISNYNFPAAPAATSSHSIALTNGSHAEVEQTESLYKQDVDDFKVIKKN